MTDIIHRIILNICKGDPKDWRDTIVMPLYKSKVGLYGFYFLLTVTILVSTEFSHCGYDTTKVNVPSGLIEER